jgi:hypothetical protein
MKFSLRDLFWLVLVCAVYLAWWSDWNRLHGIIDKQGRFWHDERREYMCAFWKERDALKAELKATKADLEAAVSQTMQREVAERCAADDNR